MIEFQKLIQQRFDQMCATGKLFSVALTGREVWDLYMQGFGNDPKFRDPESSVHNCNLCNNFIRRYGNIVAIDENYKIVSMFDVVCDEEYQASAALINNAIISSKVTEVFFETFSSLNSLNYEACKKTNSVFRLGLNKNVKRYTAEEAEKYGVVKKDEIRTFDHLHLSLPKEFVDMGTKSIEAIQGEYRDAKNVFQRAMETISLDTLNLVKDLINQGSLLDGTTHLFKIEQIIPLKQEYDALAAKDRDAWCWVKSYKLPIAKFRNELIGTLCSDLSEGKDLNEACQKWNKLVDPINYMKTTAPITAKQIAEAKTFVEENGYTESFDRRFANIDDIKVSEILHSNVGDGKIKEVSIFDGVKSTSTRHKRAEFDKVEVVSIEKFMKDILPTCTSVEAFLTNSQEGNMVSLTTAKIEDSKPIFKWNNNYSWTFNGNLAGKSQIAEAVKNAGGSINGVLRFSITWNEDGRDSVDFDLHALQPFGGEIYYSSYKGSNNKSQSSGFLDVDMIRPTKLGVENIVWNDLSKMRNGNYVMRVKNYDSGRNKGFKAEIEFNGEVYNYHHNGEAMGYTEVACVTLKNGNFTIQHSLPETGGFSTKEIYGIESNQFHKVNLVCLSPNHWGENNVGNKHYFFMLDGCKSPVSIRSFHNENLLPELAAHRKVLEVLSMQCMIESTNKQLSGLGFNSTVEDEVILRLNGSHKRVIKVRFQGVSKTTSQIKNLVNQI